ncbi:hypothetical protein GGQ68_004030 [Sagittula marina]|uniref:Uncharacterized protein n=2 Tax=Sagittula marina TaxID=943940 RepID=A0A7W6GUB9_9RHOB|nr:hypothetical protein [Sagittula marina]
MSLSLLTAQVSTGGMISQAGIAHTRSRPTDTEALLTLYDAKVSREHVEHEDRMSKIQEMQRPRRSSEASARRVERLQEKTAAYQAALNKLTGGSKNEGRVLFAAASGPDGVAVSARADWVKAVQTGDGNDAVTVTGVRVQSVYTGAGMDAVAVNGQEVQSVYSGAGADAVAVSGTVVSSIYTEGGNDAISVQAGIAGGIYGGDGSDAITVDATLGGGVARRLSLNETTAAERTALLSGDVAARYRAVQSNIADVNGGAGNDAINVSGAEAIHVAGEAGDDLISISGRTVGLHYGVGDGHDVVKIGAGTDVLLQLGARPDGSSAPEAYSVTREGDMMRLDFGNGSITFRGMMQAGTVAVLPTGWGEPTYLNAALDRTA